MKRILPTIACAVFCERVLQEQDGVLSAVRIVDTVRQIRAEPGRPRQKVQKPIANSVGGLSLLIILRPEKFKGTGTLSMRGRTPAGKNLKPVGIEVELKDGVAPANFIFNFGIPFSEEGTYWFNVYFEDEIIARVPLVVSWSAQTTPSEPEKRARLQKRRK